MELNHNGCKIIIEDNLVKCSYNGHFDKEHWQLTLNDTNICYTSDGKKEQYFRVKEIQEFQFEMGNGAYRHGDIPAAIAYVILKSDPDPQDFFYFFINEEYVFLNQTKAYDFGSKILHHFGDRYGIPVNYKLSIDTKKKQRNLIWLPVILIITFILIYLRIRLG